jgi:hypothetical protein
VQKDHLNVKHHQEATSTDSHFEPGFIQPAKTPDSLSATQSTSNAHSTKLATSIRHH